MDVYRKAEVFDSMVYYLVEVQGFWNTVDTLLTYGLSEAEVKEVLLGKFPNMFEKR